MVLSNVFIILYMFRISINICHNFMLLGHVFCLFFLMFSYKTVKIICSDKDPHDDEYRDKCDCGFGKRTEIALFAVGCRGHISLI